MGAKYRIVGHAVAKRNALETVYSHNMSAREHEAVRSLTSCILRSIDVYRELPRVGRREPYRVIRGNFEPIRQLHEFGRTI